jgi:hypothetical protein
MFVTMDVTFFESKPFFFCNSSSGENTSEDSDMFKIERTPTPNNLLEPSNSNQFVHLNIETLRLDLTTSDTFFKKTTGILGEKNVNIESLDSSCSLPSHNQNDSDTDNGNKTSTKNLELLTYSRRKHKESNLDPLQGQESKLREEPNSSECPGNNQTDSC